MSAPHLQQSDSGVWYIHWTDGRRSKRVSTRQKAVGPAKAFLAQWLTLDSAAPDEAGAALTVADLWTLYDEGHVQPEVASKQTARNCWRNLAPHFGHLLPGGISEKDVQRYAVARRAGKTGAKSKDPTIRRELATLRACINWCADKKRRHIPLASVPAFDLPPDSEPCDRWLTTDEIDRLITAAEQLRRGPRLSRGERFLALALETGARRQAILDLTWDRVDFEVGMIHYNVPGRKKTKKRRVSVPISNRLMPVLVQAHRERQNMLVMTNKGAVWATIQIIAEHAGFGDPRPRSRKAGDKPKATGISPHVLRHTAATQMARRGVPLYDIAGVLGDSIVTVEKTYAKHCPGRLKAAVDSITGGGKR